MLDPLLKANNYDRKSLDTRRYKILNNREVTGRQKSAKSLFFLTKHVYPWLIFQVFTSYQNRNRVAALINRYPKGKTALFKEQKRFALLGQFFIQKAPKSE